MLLNRSLALLAITGVLLAGLSVDPLSAQPQDFEEGVRLYQQQDYEAALSVFNHINTPEAYLFTGKSLYAMGRYQQAQSNLNNISDDAPSAIYLENVYTSALVDFQLKEYGASLNKLYQVYNENIRSPLGRDANGLYRQILNYLTPEQRLSAISQADADEIIYDLVEAALGRAEYSKTKEIFDAGSDAIDEDEWVDKIDDLKSKVSDSRKYRQEYGSSPNNLRAPDGTIYNLGIALPEYQTSDQEFGIVRSLYFGILLGAEDFNRRNRNAKISTHYINTGPTTEGLRSTVEQFSENTSGDALIGPLFSEQAEAMVPLATELKIPAIAPLANSNINSDNSYLFQSNPTFEMHGRKMARYAVRELQMERFAILAQSGSSGTVSAEAFRDEAERLGAEITYYFVENLQANEFEVSQYTRYFGSNNDPIDAVYAPLTGRPALTLIDLLLADLRVMNQPPVVLGSQEWQKLNYSSSKYDQLDIHFSQGYHLDNQNPRFSQFKQTYQNKFGMNPDQFSMIGYDVASFLFDSLDEVANPALLESAIRNHPLYRGLVNDIQFNGDNINHAVKIIEVSGTGELITK